MRRVKIAAECPKDCCPVCFEDRSKKDPPLIKLKRSSGGMHCPTCDSLFEVDRTAIELGMKKQRLRRLREERARELIKQPMVPSIKRVRDDKQLEEEVIRSKKKGLSAR